MSSEEGGCSASDEGLPRKEKTISKELKEAIFSFNVKPSRGLSILQDKLSDDRTLAQFLYEHRENLSKAGIGDLLGSEKYANLLKDYVELFDFSQDSFIEAIRRFLSAFRLPGEAQKIDRVMERFARKLYRDHKKTGKNHLKSADAAYVLAFAVIMLNTDLHSSGVKRKMTLEQFLQNLRGVNDSSNIDEDFLSDIYNDILHHPLRVTTENQKYGEAVAFLNVDKEGWLLKRSNHGIPKWDRRWFALTDACLYYFKLPTDEQPRCIVPLEDVRIQRLSASTFELVAKDRDILKSAKFIESGLARKEERLSLVLKAQSVDDAKAWIVAIQKEVDTDPFYSTLRAKKEMSRNWRSSVSLASTRSRKGSIRSASSTQAPSECNHSSESRNSGSHRGISTVTFEVEPATPCRLRREPDEVR